MLEFEDLKKQPMFCFLGFVLGFLFVLGFFLEGGGSFRFLFCKFQQIEFKTNLKVVI